MANEHRGEVSIELPIGAEPKTFVMRPTFNFVAAVESECNCGLYMLFQKFTSGTWSTLELVAVIFAGLEAAEQGVNIRDVREAVMKAGPLTLTTDVARLLTNALSGGEVQDSGN